MILNTNKHIINKTYYYKNNYNQNNDEIKFIFIHLNT